MTFQEAVQILYTNASKGNYVAYRKSSPGRKIIVKFKGDEAYVVRSHKTAEEVNCELTVMSTLANDWVVDTENI